MDVIAINIKTNVVTVVGSFQPGGPIQPIIEHMEPDEDSIFTSAESGKYKTGDIYGGKKP